MHVCITILLGLNQLTAFAAKLLQGRGRSRTPQYLRWSSLQHVQTAESR